jgi:hypothetical protein
MCYRFFFTCVFCVISFFTTSANATGAKKVFEKYRNSYFVETGSFEGLAISWAVDLGYKDIRSIEITKYYYEYCKNIFASNENVQIWFGDSAYLLGKMIKEIDEPITFWLDGHWSGGETGKGESFTPLLKELDQIAQHPVHTHTILIDDVRCFGTDVFDFTLLDQVVEKIYEINPNYQIIFEDGAFQKDILVAFIQS